MDEVDRAYPVTLRVRKEFAELRMWVRAPGFRRGGLFGKTADQRFALRQLKKLRRQLFWVIIQRACARRDARDWQAAKAWVAADSAEVEAELIETLSRGFPRRQGERTPVYQRRLQAIREAFRKQSPVSAPEPATDEVFGAA